MFQIIDEKNRVIHAGSEFEMQRAWFVLTWDQKTLHRMFSDAQLAMYKQMYNKPFDGKLRMVSTTQYENNPIAA